MTDFVSNVAGPLLGEVRKTVPGYEGSYEVSDFGRVYSLDRVTVDTLGRGRPFKGRLLKPRIDNPGGYLSVNLSRGPKKHRHRVHALVLAAFVGPRPTGMRHTRHLNGNPLDCRLENLVYGTIAENAADRIHHGTARNAFMGRTQCSQGHEYTPENTRYYRRPSNGRIERLCCTCRGLNPRPYPEEELCA